VHPIIAKKLSLAGHQRRVSTYALVEVKRARVDRGGFRLVILVRLEAPRKHGVLVQPACLVYEFVRPSLVHMLVQMCAPSVQMSESGVLVEEL
jgi:hypothetical protein